MRACKSIVVISYDELCPLRLMDSQAFFGLALSLTALVSGRYLAPIVILFIFMVGVCCVPQTQYQPANLDFRKLTSIYAIFGVG